MQHRTILVRDGSHNIHILLLGSPLLDPVVPEVGDVDRAVIGHDDGDRVGKLPRAIALVVATDNTKRII